MKAVLLAAGTSSRLRSLCADRPKCLLDVAGAPILRRALDHLAASGVDDVTVVTGFQEARIREALEAWRLPIAVRLVTNPAYERTNNAYSLLQARPHVDGDAFFLLDADIVFAREVIVRLAASPAADALALRPADDLGAEEIKCELDGTGAVRQLGKHVPPEVAAGESIGIERFSRETSARLFDVLADRMGPRALVNEYYEASFQELIDGGLKLHAVSMDALPCAEIDTPDDLAAADALMRRADRTPAG